MVAVHRLSLLSGSLILFHCHHLTRLLPVSPSPKYLHMHVCMICINFQFHNNKTALRPPSTSEFKTETDETNLLVSIHFSLQIELTELHPLLPLIEIRARIRRSIIHALRPRLGPMGMINMGNKIIIKTKENLHSPVTPIPSRA